MWRINHVTRDIGAALGTLPVSTRLPFGVYPTVSPATLTAQTSMHRSPASEVLTSAAPAHMSYKQPDDASSPQNGGNYSPAGRDVRTTRPPLVDAPWAKSADQALSLLSVEVSDGLASSECLRRQRIYGSNLLRQAQPRRALAILIDQLESVVVLLLIGAAGLSLAFGDFLEASAIVAVIFLNTAIGFLTELRAVRSMEALRKLGNVSATVRRDGNTAMVPAQALVPGDIVLLEGGDVVTADMRLVNAAKLQADESMLTGESMPVAKDTALLEPESHLADRNNMVFKGTAINRGSAEAVVVATGHQTELGRITQLVESAQAADTPLEKKLDALGRRLAWITLGIAILVAAIGVFSGRDMQLSIEIAIALAVAAIPEGLPIVATIALARGVWRMARRNALVSKLSAVETLGATSVILTDKTGTLTENRMTVCALELPDNATLTISGTGLELQGALLQNGREPAAEACAAANELMMSMVLCNNASLRVDAADVQAIGDPTEIALLVAARKCNIVADEVSLDMPEIREEPFDPATGMMATFNSIGQDLSVHVKGAPEAVLESCTRVRSGAGDADLDQDARQDWRRRCAVLAESGLRTLAVATKAADSSAEDPYRDLVLLGLVGLMDPPRLGVREALDACRKAGVNVVMVTGDHLATATHIAIALGMVDDDAARDGGIDARGMARIAELSADERDRLLRARIIARASPEQKLDLISLFQDSGKVVAMTGDGVNDAPALKQADIGIAMGIRGTQVAKEAAAMVLQDDEFSTISSAIYQGRSIYANIRKFVVYLLSCNISEIMIVTAATAAGAPVPLLPLQILFLNLVTDVFPALALGVGEGARSLMTEQPRTLQESVVTRYHWLLILSYGSLMCATVLAAMFLAIHWLEFDSDKAVTVSFLTLALAQLWHVFNMREYRSAWYNNEVSSNPWVWGAIVLCLAILAVAVYVPGLRGLLALDVPGYDAWMLIIAMSVVPLLFGPLLRALIPRLQPTPQDARLRPKH